MPATLLRGVVFWAVASSAFAGAQAPRKPWTIDYATSGGIAGLHWRLTLSDDGRAQLARGLYRPVETQFVASSVEMAGVAAALSRLNLESAQQAKPQRPPMPDSVQTSIEIAYGGQKYLLGSEGRELAAALRPVISRGMQRMTEEQWDRAGPFRPGRTWEVQLQVRDKKGVWHGEYWRGVWRRRDDSLTFDAVWRNTGTHEEVSETVVLEAAARGHVVLHGSVLCRTMEGTYSPDDPSFVSGSVPPPNTAFWEARIKDR
jgi:hypothetical protein